MFWLGLTGVSLACFGLAAFLFGDVWRWHKDAPSANTEHGIVITTVFLLVSAALSITAYTRQFPIGDLNAQSGTFLRGVILFGLLYIILRRPQPEKA